MRSLVGVLNIFGSLLTWFSLYFALPILTALVYGEFQTLRRFVLRAGGGNGVFVVLHRDVVADVTTRHSTPNTHVSYLSRCVYDLHEPAGNAGRLGGHEPAI